MANKFELVLKLSAERMDLLAELEKNEEQLNAACSKVYLSNAEVPREVSEPESGQVIAQNTKTRRGRKPKEQKAEEPAGQVAESGDAKSADTWGFDENGPDGVPVDDVDGNAESQIEPPEDTATTDSAPLPDWIERADISPDARMLVQIVADNLSALDGGWMHQDTIINTARCEIGELAELSELRATSEVLKQLEECKRVGIMTRQRAESGGVQWRIAQQ